MTRTLVSSTLGEGDYLPTGEFAVNRPNDGVATHLGMLPFPPGETGGLLFPVITNVGGFKIAGQCNSTVRGAAVWYSGAWHDDVRLPVGTKPCIWDNFGALVVNDGSAGSQGYRYVTPANVIKTGDQTYAALNGINEWTDLSITQDRSLMVGQANWTYAVILWDGTHHRLIEAVNGRFVTAHRSGDLVSLTYMTPGAAVLLSATVAELLTLPIYEPQPIPPDPIPTPEPPEPIPTPEPEPEPEPPPSVFPTLHVYRIPHGAKTWTSKPSQSKGRAASTAVRTRRTPARGPISSKAGGASSGTASPRQRKRTTGR